MGGRDGGRRHIPGQIGATASRAAIFEPGWRRRRLSGGGLSSVWSVSLKLSCAPHRRRNPKPSIPLLLGTSERNGGRGRKNHSSSFFFLLHTDSPLSPLFLYSTPASTFILFPTLPPSFASSVRPKVHPPPPYPRYHHLPPPPPIPGGESCVGGGGGGLQHPCLSGPPPPPPPRHHHLS